ncbi:hypothetical protein DPMN_083110 [Dreissena polymorpha]|uniref:Uncharacterized protein n=1 Tax=Dreissena polymorpha TaxID=45954 RepID=A0A9D3Y9B8_DREPO|nr:hypothetical protein DPMN_083110 [Dreissena polymorpha]
MAEWSPGEPGKEIAHCSFDLFKEGTEPFLEVFDMDSFDTFCHEDLVKQHV